MTNSSSSGWIVSSLLAFAVLGTGCSDEGEPSTTIVRSNLAPAAHGWANVWPGEGGRVTNGGAGADAAHIYTVTNRTELVRALYPDAVIADDGTFTSEQGADATPKLIYVRGTISLSTNAAGRELTLEDYACEGYDFEAFKARYAPSEWNTVLVDGAPREILPCPGSQEELRRCSVRRQRAVVELKVGSNTSLLGLGSDARIVHGGLVIGGSVPAAAPAMGSAPLDPELAEACGIELPPQPEPGEPAAPTPAPAAELIPTADNVIVRNITFEDAFDMFPAWTPGDSYSEPPEVADPEALYPLCQAGYDAASNAGPHQCPGGRWNSEYDNLRVQNATHVWIDHCTFNDGERGLQSSVWPAPYDQYAIRLQPHDGALDINGYSDFVTVSRSVFRNHDKVMLIGGSDTVRESNGWGALSVTVHHNQFINVGQRLPRVRFGRVHVFSNYIRGTLPPAIDSAADRESKTMPPYPMGSGLAVGHLAKVYSENNVYELEGYPGDEEPTDLDAVQVAHRATPSEGTTPDVNEQTYFFDSGSLLNDEPAELMEAAQQRAMTGNRPPLLATDSVWKPSDSYAYGLTDAEDVEADLGRTAGAGRITVSAPR